MQLTWETKVSFSHIPRCGENTINRSTVVKGGFESRCLTENRMCSEARRLARGLPPSWVEFWDRRCFGGITNKPDGHGVRSLSHLCTRRWLWVPGLSTSFVFVIPSRKVGPGRWKNQVPLEKVRLHPLSSSSYRHYIVIVLTLYRFWQRRG